MHEAIKIMLDKYQCQTREDYVNALREIIQELALLGLWRSKFFEHAAFYGGTALRILYGLDRYSEDIDFSLLKRNQNFSLSHFGSALCREIESFGFNVSFERREKTAKTSIDSAFLKAATYQELIAIEADQQILQGLHSSKILKIKLEVDTDPPSGFVIDNKYLLQPIPFSIRVFSLPDLFAGKLHAILCRKWKTRVKGRDWYDLVWYATHHPAVNIRHLENRMRQSGDYKDKKTLTRNILIDHLQHTINNLNIESARKEVEPFVKNKRALEVWSHDFFSHVIELIKIHQTDL